MGDWNARQYLMFQNERTQPAIDLVNRIGLERSKSIIDIGCGPGNSTIILKERFPDAYLLGLDNSEDMISTAKIDHPNIDFMVCDVNTELAKLDKEFDIVFSNEETIRLYELREKAIHDEATRLLGAREEGMKEGEMKKAIETAKAALAKGIAKDVIADITGLEIEQIEKLQKEYIH